MGAICALLPLFPILLAFRANPILEPALLLFRASPVFEPALLLFRDNDIVDFDFVCKIRYV